MIGFLVSALRESVGPDPADVFIAWLPVLIDTHIPMHLLGFLYAYHCGVPPLLLWSVMFCMPVGRVIQLLCRRL